MRVASGARLFRLARADFNRADDGDLVMHATAFAARLAADKAFVDLDGMLSADCVALGLTMPARSL